MKACGSKLKKKEIITHAKGGSIYKIKLEDGNYLEVKNLTKDQRAGRKPIGVYKGVKQYLKGDGTAGPSYREKQ